VISTVAAVLCVMPAVKWQCCRSGTQSRPATQTSSCGRLARLLVRCGVNSVMRRNRNTLMNTRQKR